MPYIRRCFVEPLIMLKNGSPRLQYLQQLEKTQFFSEQQLREIQWKRLRDLLDFVYKNNEFYRERFRSAGLVPEAINSPELFSQMPILTKTEIRAAGLGLISHGYSVEALQQAKTGGSTGRALELYYTEKCSELRNACARRHDRWTGWEPGEPIAACWGNPCLPKTIIDKLRSWLLQPMIYLDTMKVNDASIRSFVKEWYKVKPTLLFGHAHSLYLLAIYLKKLCINDLRPKGILSSSMMLIPGERKVIEETFGTSVIDRYGCEEVSLIACECRKHEGMHLNIEHLFVEFIKEDGESANFGELGRIIVTDLMNHAMPLIRYQVEDMGVPTDRRCSCGRGLPLMESVAGRVADFLIKSDGTRVAGISLIENTLTRFDGLDQMQIVQEDLKHFELRLVVGESYGDKTEKKLVDYFKSVFGNDIEIIIKVIESLSPERSGKYRFSICNIK